MLPFVIRTGSCVLMKAKEGAKGTVINSTGKYVWNIKWDDGKIHADKKSQQLKAEPRVLDSAPPASITIPRGKCRIFLPLVVSDQFSSHAIVLLLADHDGSRPVTTIMAAHAGDGDDGRVDFGIFNDDDEDDDVPALLDNDIIGIDDDDESIDSMPGTLGGARIVDLDDEEEIDGDNLPAEDEDGLIGVDDHIVDGDLEDLDEHAAKSEAYVARKAGDIGKGISLVE